MNDFKEQGNWGTVAATGGAGVFSYACVKFSEPQITPVIGKMDDLNTTKLKNNEFKVADQLPNMGSPKANWKQNSGVLRSYMDGRAIKDVSIYPMENAGFLGAERNLLKEHGYQYSNGYWIIMED